MITQKDKLNAAMFFAGLAAATIAAYKLWAKSLYIELLVISFIEIIIFLTIFFIAVINDRAASGEEAGSVLFWMGACLIALINLLVLFFWWLFE